MKRIQAEGVNLVIYEPTLKEDTFLGNKVMSDLEQFKQSCDVIIANRFAPDLEDVREKVYTRDLFHKD